MTSKERVNTVLEHKVPDRVPLGFYAIDFDTVSRILGHETYLRAKAKTRIALWEGRRNEVAQSLKEDMEELCKKLDCIDIINLMAEATGLLPPADYDPDPPEKIGDGLWQDRDGLVYKLSEETADIVVVENPTLWTREYKKEDFKKDESKLVLPDPSCFEVIDHIISALGGKKFIIGHSGTSSEMPMYAPMERAMTEFALNEETVMAFAEYNLWKGCIEDEVFIRPGQDMVMWGQDFSYNAGPLISPQMFESFVLPFAKERVKNIKDNFAMSVFKHSCGNNKVLLDYFIEIGWVGYQAIQPSAGMDIRELKEDYGEKLCLWTGVSIENLVSGTCENVRKDVRYAMEYGKTGGGFIFGSSHSVGVGSKYDNFMASLDEYDKLADY